MKMNKTIVFDLDDTLVPELDYLESAYREIAALFHPQSEELFQKMIDDYHNGINVFQNLITQYPSFTLTDLLMIYRNHIPQFPRNNSYSILHRLKEKGYNLGIITDGYTITQSNKINALGITQLLDKIVISEAFGSTKPAEENFRVFHEFQSEIYYYIGDNTKKDFVTPNKLGWTSVCLLDQGKNIHTQNFDVESSFLPQYKIKELEEIITLVS